MRRGARNADGSLSLPGVGRLPGRLVRPRGARGNPETALVQRPVVQWAKRNRELLWLARVQSGSGRTHGGAWLELAEKGTPDLLGCAVGLGRFVAVECKLVGGARPTAEQREALERIVAAGGWAFVPRSLEEFVADFLEARAGRYRPPACLAADCGPRSDAVKSSA